MVIRFTVGVPGESEILQQGVDGRNDRQSVKLLLLCDKSRK